MTVKGYRHVSVKDETYEILEQIRKRKSLRSIAQTIDYLAEVARSAIPGDPTQ